MKKIMCKGTEKKNVKGRDEKMKKMMKKAAQLAAVMMLTVSSMMGCVSKHEDENDTKTAVNNRKDEEKKKEKDTKKDRDERKEDVTDKAAKKRSRDEEVITETTAQATGEKEAKPSSHKAEKPKKPQGNTNKTKNPQKQDAAKPGKQDHSANKGDKEENKQDQSTNKEDKEENQGENQANKGDTEENKQEDQANHGDKEENKGEDQTNKEENQSVDDSALRTALKEAESMDTSLYTPSSCAIFQKTITEAKQLVEKGNLKEADIQSWITRIQQAKQQLIVKGDKTALRALLKTAEAYPEKTYTPTTYQALQSAVKKAKQVLENEDASQTMVDTAMQTVETAMRNLVKRADVTALQELMAQAAMMDKDSYVAESYDRLEKALAQAEAVVQDAQALQQDVNAVITLIEQAIMDLELYIAPDMTELTQVLKQAMQVSADDYSAVSYQNLQTAIQQGEAVQGMKQPTQTQVEEAVAKLKTALQGLSVDTEELEAAISQARAFHEDCYTSDSYQYMLSIITKAEAFLQNHPTQKEVDALYDELQEAMQKLVVEVKVDKTQLQTKLDELKQVDERVYTPSSYRKLKEAIAAGEAVCQDETANEKQVADAVALLDQAQQNLVQRADCTALEALLEEAQQALQGNYLKDGLVHVKEVMTSATETKEDADADQARVDASCEALRKAIDALVEKGDGGQLQEMVAAAKELDVSHYTPDSAAAYLAVVEKAQTLLDQDEFAKQAEMDMIKELQQAQAALVEQKVDMTKLQKLLKECEAYVLEDYYTKDSITVFQTTMAQAQALLHEEKATQQEVDTMTSRLQEAVQGLQTVENLSEKLAARLQDVTLVDARVHTKDSVAVLKQCAQDIQAQMADVTLSDQVRIQLLQQLETAFAQLQLDTSQVEAMIAKAEAVDTSKYTAESIQNMNEALQTAQNVVGDTSHTADALAQAMDALDYAMTQLVEVPKTGLKEQLEALLLEGEAKVGDHNANDFTTESYERYAKAVFDAKRAVRWIENDSYDLSKPSDLQTVTDIRDELQKAIQELTLAEGIKPEDQAYIDTLQAAITKGKDALAKGGYPPVQGKTLANKVANVEESVAGIQNHTISYPHNEEGQQMIQQLADSITTAIAKLYEEPVVETIPVQQEVVDLLNEKRRAAGLSEVVIDEQLSQAASKRASEMSEYFYVSDASFADDAHKRPDGSRYDTIKAEFGISGLMAENAAFSATNATQLFNAWWSSTGHRQNMMTADFTRIGVADIKVGEEGYTLGYMLLAE